MADDAGALLVRSGLVSASALDEARARVANDGGTVGEELVASGAVADDDLTEFYCQRLLVPQVNPNTLARLSPRVVSSIPTDMAIELRAIPVSLDGENNLTVAMSDPSDRHAVDEIAFFTGTYVVRAVATQMQIAWCLAHYYGHVTLLGQRLLQAEQPELPASVASYAGAASERLPRAKGVTGRINATRHRAIAPVTGPLDLPRPRSGDLDQSARPVAASESAPGPTSAPGPEGDGVPDQPRARSVSGEIRVPSRRAASIRPPMPPIDEDDADYDQDDDGDTDDSGPLITINRYPPDDGTFGTRRTLPRRRVKTDPPELAARAGEVDIATGPVRMLDADEPRIIIAEDDLAEPRRGVTELSGEFRIAMLSTAGDDQPMVPSSSIEIDDTSVGVMIHDYVHQDSEPVLLERRRPSDPPVTITQRAPSSEDGGDPDDDDVVVLDAPKPTAPLRSEKRTQAGIGVAPAFPRPHHDTEAMGIPSTIEDGPTEAQLDDPTRVDALAAPPPPDDNTDETLAPPPSPAHRAETSPHIAPPAPTAALPRAVTLDDDDIDDEDAAEDEDEDEDEDAAEDEDDDDDLLRGPETSVMSAVELDAAIPHRSAEVVPAHLAPAGDHAPVSNRFRIEYDAVDDGWGPPGTTIPPPLLGAMPGSDDDPRPAAAIPMLDVDSAPLIVAPPAPPEPARGAPAISETSGPSLVRALEDATSRSIELIHALERAKDRDGVVALMIAHLGETHLRAGFFSIKPGVARGSELAVFSIEPVPAVLPVTTLRLDHPSTLQDVVGTRLPYRGPMHDDASRNFLAAVLGACPPEILLVPVVLRERVVGVLFGEHRMRHTFDDQLAVAARAAGMALERILKAKRG